jgi:predicted RNA-binding Zn-ribbon protein involved in translation (DUF1610 family)
MPSSLYFFRSHEVNCPKCGWIARARLKLKVEGLKGGSRRIRCCPKCGAQILRSDSHPRRRWHRA